jgi:hypothetical protein
MKVVLDLFVKVMGLDLKAYLKRFHEMGERRYVFSAIEKRSAPLRERRKWLTPDDVSWVLHTDNAPFGKYWPMPSKKPRSAVQEAIAPQLGLTK